MDPAIETLLAEERRANDASDRPSQADLLDRLEALAAELGDLALSADVAGRRAEWCLRTAAYQAGLDAAARARTAARLADRADLESHALRQGAMCLLPLGQAERALEWSQRAVNLSQALRDERGTALALGNLGVVSLHLNLVSVAKDFLEDSARRWERLEDRRMHAAALNNLANALMRLGEFGPAILSQQKAFELLADTPHQGLSAHVMTTLARLLATVGQPGVALASLAEAQRMGRAANDPKIVAYSMLREAEVRADNGDLEGAAAALEESARMQAEYGIEAFVFLTQAERARLEFAAGRPAEALALIEALSQPSEDPDASLLLLKAETLSELGRHDEAATAVTALLEALDTEEDGQIRGPGVYYRAHAVAAAAGEADLAASLLEAGDGLASHQSLLLTDRDLNASYTAAMAALRRQKVQGHVESGRGVG